MSATSAMLGRYRDWLLEDRSSPPGSTEGVQHRFYAGSMRWRGKMTASGSREGLRLDGVRIAREIAGRPMAEGADRE